jgi:hypothetical protein
MHDYAWLICCTGGLFFCAGGLTKFLPSLTLNCNLPDLCLKIAGIMGLESLCLAQRLTVKFSKEGRRKLLYSLCRGSPGWSKAQIQGGKLLGNEAANRPDSQHRLF